MIYSHNQKIINTLKFEIVVDESVTCFRCDGKGKVRNEFGMWEKCESCQKPDMKFESASPQPDVNEEGL